MVPVVPVSPADRRSVYAEMNLKAILFPSSPSRFRRNFTTVAGANLVAVVCPLLATPLLTRLYTPSDFGRLAVFGAVLAIIGAICTARFDWVMPNAASRGAVAGLAIAGMAVVVAATVATVAGVAIACLLVDAPALWWLLPAAVAGTGARSLLTGWFVRTNDLAPTSRATISRSIANVILSLGGGVLRTGAVGLVFATVASIWMGIGTMMRRAGPSLWSAVRRSSFPRIRASVRPHLANASWSTAVSILNAASLNMPLLLLAVFYDALEVGWYALMLRIVMAPMSVFAGALGSSFWAHAADHARAGRVRQLAADYRRTTVRLALAAMPVALACLAGPFVVGPILGKTEWSGAGWVLLAMTPLFLGTIVFAPTNHLVVLDRQRLQLVTDGLRLAGTVLAIGICHLVGASFGTTVLAISCTSFAGNACLYPIHRHVHRRMA